MSALALLQLVFGGVGAMWGAYLLVALYFYYRRCLLGRPAQQFHAVLEVDAADRPDHSDVQGRFGNYHLPADHSRLRPDHHGPGLSAELPGQRQTALSCRSPIRSTCWPPCSAWVSAWRFSFCCRSFGMRPSWLWSPACRYWSSAGPFPRPLLLVGALVVTETILTYGRPNAIHPIRDYIGYRAEGTSWKTSTPLPIIIKGGYMAPFDLINAMLAAYRLAEYGNRHLIFAMSPSSTPLANTGAAASIPEANATSRRHGKGAPTRPPFLARPHQSFRRPKMKTSFQRDGWPVVLGLLLLGLRSRTIAGMIRLTDLAGGAVPPPTPPAFSPSPMPIALHVTGSLTFALLGAFQFAPVMRRRWPGAAQDRRTDSGRCRLRLGADRGLYDAELRPARKSTAPRAQRHPHRASALP